MFCRFVVFCGHTIKEKKLNRKKNRFVKKEKVESVVIRKYESFILVETINHKVSIFKMYNGNLCCAADFRLMALKCIRYVYHGVTVKNAKSIGNVFVVYQFKYPLAI